MVPATVPAVLKLGRPMKEHRGAAVRPSSTLRGELNPLNICPKVKNVPRARSELTWLFDEQLWRKPLLLLMLPPSSLALCWFCRLGVLAGLSPHAGRWRAAGGGSLFRVPTAAQRLIWHFSVLEL